MLSCYEYTVTPYNYYDYYLALYTPMTTSIMTNIMTLYSYIIHITTMTTIIIITNSDAAWRADSAARKYLSIYSSLSLSLYIYIYISDHVICTYVYIYIHTIHIERERERDL